LGKIDREWHHHILGGVGVFFCDYRGERSWHRSTSGVTETTLIGTKQMKKIVDCFKKGGEFDNLSKAIFVSSIPLILLPKK